MEQRACSFKRDSLDPLKRDLVKAKDGRTDCAHSQKFPEEGSMPGRSIARYTSVQPQELFAKK
ncbi:hypothetical protein ANCDUO_13152 [Ancylostoma duodenale]|uniref:Uncharacterized protein n=1 Tax=Ancylostoma duodenale TaxID=51022 RepID=A0A0C2D3N3_9BILA|nr:hypothetical protein ANCDUO_13152 [Ancylostoma duodenale]